MKTTLNIDESVIKRIKDEALRSGSTMSEIVETALRRFLDRPTASPELPSFDGGGVLVDVSDRDALYHAMEGR